MESETEYMTYLNKYIGVSLPEQQILLNSDDSEKSSLLIC